MEQKSDLPETQPQTYDEWIEQMQKSRNAEWEMNVMFEAQPDTEKPPAYDKFVLFHDGVENYAMTQTTVASANL